MAKTSNISFERDYLNSLKAGLKNYLKHNAKVEFHYSVVNQYLELFDKVVNIKTLDEYRNLKPMQVKVLIDQYAKDKGIEIKEHRL